MLPKRCILKDIGVIENERRSSRTFYLDDRILSPIEKAPSDAMVFEASGFTLCPSYIDTHVHIAGIDSITGRSVPGIDTYLKNISLLKKGGVMQFRDCASPDLLLFQERERIVSSLGVRYLACGRPITVPRGHLHSFGVIAGTDDELKAAVRKLVEDGSDFIKIMASGGVLTPSSNPDKPQYSRKQLETVVKEARKLGKLVSAHAHSAESINNCALAGIDIIEHCSFYNPFPGDDKAFSIMARKGIMIGATIYQDSYHPSMRSVVEYTKARYRHAIDSGVEILLSTDAWGKGNRFDVFGRMIRCAVEDFGFTLEETYRFLWKNPKKLGFKDHGYLILEGDPGNDLGTFQRIVRQVGL